MEYISESEHSDCCSWGWGMQARRWYPASNLDTSRTQLPDTKPKSLKGVCSAAGVTSQRGTSVDTKIKVLPVSRLWGWIKTRISHRGFGSNIAGLIKSMGLECAATEWRFFLDSSSRILQEVFPRNWDCFFIYLYWAFITNERRSQRHGLFVSCC